MPKLASANACDPEYLPIAKHRVPKMEQQQIDYWLDVVLPKHHRLTSAVITILENILQSNGVDYLAISGRTKEKKSAIEKITRKGYQDPKEKLTDLSGIRVIVYFESDVKRVTELINSAFSIDQENSSNKDALLSINQIGYRSSHAVCDLGENRGQLPEFSGLNSLKFEVQIRTVLQHAWAELAHDRNYKFTGKLPYAVERQMYLYAGMLEIADKGFDELSKEIDHYAAELAQKTKVGDLSSEVNSISLEQFVINWARESEFPLEEFTFKPKLSDIVRELNQFGVKTLADLKEIIPLDYVSNARNIGYKTNIYGVVRDWMLIHDWRKLIKFVYFNWMLDLDEQDIYCETFSPDEYKEFISAFSGALKLIDAFGEGEDEDMYEDDDVSGYDD
jgi:putative GTP pyrophosphokinase